MATFNHLPTEIKLEILARLPTESVLDCKLVCKPWGNLVSHHPSFAQMHLTHLNQSSESASKLGFLLLNDSSRQFYYFEYDDETATSRIRRINLTSPFAYGCEIFGSFNGLVCLYEYRHGIFCICNPLTKEYVKLPEFNRDSGSIPYVPLTRGFGYLPSTNEYKVVEIDRLPTDLNVVEVLVYTVGSGNGWRNVGRFNIESGEAGCVENGVYMNGKLHWMEIEEGTVFVFDLAEEKFCHHVSPPPLLPGSTSLGYSSLGVLGGALYYGIRYFCQISESVYYDVWSLKGMNDIGDTKEQGTQEAVGWSKEFGFRRRRPFAFTKSGAVLFFDDSSLGIYDAIASTSRELVRFNAVSQICPHKNTLVSLKELGEDDVKIMDSAKLIEYRKPFFPTKELAR